jgi:ATP-binding cassette, subfamily B (MDR/TAP), member 1
MSVMILMTSMERISSPLIAIGKAQIAATAFFAVIDAPPPRTGSLRAPEVAATGDIVFRDVTFAYPGRPSDLVLDGLTLTLEGGKTTAIVGPSGAGKSTIVGLLVRWYGLRDQGTIARVKPKPAKGDTAPKKEDGEEGEETALKEKTSQPPVQLRGSISTGGCELDDIDLPWWRSQIGLVQQEPFLFNDTIFNNVAHGLVGTDLEHEGEAKKRELVAAACREAFADEFINRLPDGYDTVVGESGAKLSGMFLCSFLPVAETCSTLGGRVNRRG